jgi:hypothetical protein
LTAPLAFVRRRRSAERPAPGRRWRLGRRAAACASLAGAAFLVLVAVQLFGDVRDYLFSVPLSFRLTLALPFLVGVLALAGVAGTVAGWREPGVRVLARVHQVALLTGTAAVLWFALQWSLVGG